MIVFSKTFGYNKGSYNSGNISINNWNIREDKVICSIDVMVSTEIYGWTITDQHLWKQCFDILVTVIGLSSWIVTSTQIGYSMDSFCKDCNSLGLNQHIDISNLFWDYTYYRFTIHVYRCGCLGINSNSSF